MHRQEGPRHDLVETLVHRQHLNALQQLLGVLRPGWTSRYSGSIADRTALLVWDLVKAERDGEILIEVSDAVRESLIAHMDGTNVAATGQLDTDEIADLAPDLPREVMLDVFKSLSIEEREQLRAAMSYPEDAVGALMDFDMIQCAKTSRWKWCRATCAALTEFPDHTDQLFVVDRDDRFKGVLPLIVVVNEPERLPV